QVFVDLQFRSIYACADGIPEFRPKRTDESAMVSAPGHVVKELAVHAPTDVGPQELKYPIAGAQRRLPNRVRQSPGGRDFFVGLIRFQSIDVAVISDVPSVFHAQLANASRPF